MYMPDDIQEIFTRACNDCHTNETTWPWYSYIMPVSYWVADHVEAGRGDLNFSKWEKYSTKKKVHKLEEVKEVLEADVMPLWEYTLLHPSANLSKEDRQKIYDWVETELSKLALNNAVKPGSSSDVQATTR